MLYYDTRGNALTETEYMQLLPFNNRRKLKLMGLMPDSLDGVALTTDVLKNVKRSMLVADRSFSYGLAPLLLPLSLLRSQPGGHLPDSRHGGEGRLHRHHSADLLARADAH